MTLDPKRRIGGSVIPKIVGLSRFGTPLDAYMELKDGVTVEYDEADEANEDIDRGNFLEPALREWAAKKLKAEGMVKPHETIAMAIDPDFTYSPDGLFYSPADAAPALLEVKAPGVWTAADWGEEMTDQVPDEYAIQGQWGLMVTGRSVCYFAALISGRLKLFKMVADVALQTALQKKALEFMKNHVHPGIPPPVTFGDDEYLRKKFPRSNGVYLDFAQMTAGQQATVRDFLSAYVSHKELEKIVEKTWKPRMKEMIGEHSGIQFPETLAGCRRIDFNNNKDGLTIDWEQVARTVGNALMVALNDKDAALATMNTALEMHSEMKPGNRPLVPRMEKKKGGE